jgi:chitinase
MEALMITTQNLLSAGLSLALALSTFATAGCATEGDTAADGGGTSTGEDTGGGSGTDGADGGGSGTDGGGSGTDGGDAGTGGGGSGTDGGDAGGAGCAAPWSASQVYTGGMVASEDGGNYVANWWTQGQSPASNSGPTGSAQPWTTAGVCAACSTVPAAPTNLTASSTTGTSTTLTWEAATVASGCAVTGYEVFQGGTRIGSVPGTRFLVSGLANETAYTFTVAAVDAAGASLPSAPVDVTTGTGGGGSAGRLFAPYIDLSLTSSQQLLAIQQQSGIRVFTLAFIVDNGSCQASWGGLGQTLPDDTLPNGTTISALVEGIRQNGGDVIVSFGGAVGADLGAACGSAAEVQAMYQSVIDRYGVKMVDFDIEGYAASRQPAVDLRNQAVKGLKAANPGLVVSYTLPVLPTGLVEAGLNILAAVKSCGLDLDVVNVMAMDYGAALDNGGQMGRNAIEAATATEAQIRQAGLSATVGVTPMIGVNDVASEVFQLSDAEMLLEYARSNPSVSRLSMWSVSRDSGSCPGQAWASPVCSGIAQAGHAFARVFNAF